MQLIYLSESGQFYYNECRNWFGKDNFLTLMSTGVNINSNTTHITNTQTLSKKKKKKIVGREKKFTVPIVKYNVSSFNI